MFQHFIIKYVFGLNKILSFKNDTHHLLIVIFCSKHNSPNTQQQRSSAPSAAKQVLTGPELKFITFHTSLIL